MFCPTCLYVSKPTIPIPDNTFILYVNTHSSLTPFPGYINKEFISPELVIDKINYSAFGFPAIVGTFPGGIIEPYNIFKPYKKYEEFLDAMHILPDHFKKMSAKKYKYDFSPKTIKKIESQIIPNELVVTRESFTTLINKIYTVNNSDRLRGFEIYLKNVKTNAMISLLNISELNKIFREMIYDPGLLENILDCPKYTVGREQFITTISLNSILQILSGIHAKNVFILDFSCSDIALEDEYEMFAGDVLSKNALGHKKSKKGKTRKRKIKKP
jgi:hypothetical protein